MSDLIIIGGGPAALAAAIYALGKQLDVLIITDDLGGKANWRQRLTGQLDDEHLAGEQTVMRFEQRIAKSGRVIHDHATRVEQARDGFRVATRNHGTLTSTAVIVATGAIPVGLNVPGSKEFLGQGLGYSVTTHAHLMAGKTVAIVGNTVRALRGAAELAQTADRLVLIVPDASLLADPLARSLAERPNVEIMRGGRVKEVTGGFNVEELIIEHDGNIKRVAVDAAFVDLGLHASSGMVRELLGIEAGQFIGVDAKNATSVPGLFAAGDVTTAFGEQILIAIGEGAKAALSAYDYLLTKASVQAGAVH